MTDDRRQHDHSDCDPLDRLLRDAPSPGADAEQIERLGSQWNRITRRRRLTQTGMTVLFSLTVVTVTAGIFWSYGQRARGPGMVPDLANQVPTPRAAPSEDTQSPLQFVGSPAPEPFEQLISVAARRKSRVRREEKRKRQAAEARLEEPSFDDIFRIAVKRVHDGQDLDEVMSEHREQLTEQNLVRAIVAQDEQAASAALQLLSRVVTDRSLPLLLRLRARREFEELATEMVLRVADEQTLYRLARQEPDRTVRRRLCGALLQTGSDLSVHLFLQLVDGQRTSAAAVAAVDDVEALPVDRLLACLHARQRSVRLTAAFVLGRSNDEQVVSKLLQLVQFSQSRRAALVGLLASENELAQQFLDHARHDVYLAASLHVAQTVVRSFPTES